MKENRKNKRAFTLAELLIVVAILAIILTVGIITIVNVRKNIKLKTYDASAKEIYLAAQNQMLQMKEYGQWDALIAAHSVNDVPVASYFGIKLAKEPSSDDWIPSDFGYWHSDLEENDQAWPNIRENMYLIAFTGSGAIPELIQRILPSGTVEDGVRTAGTYVIEYNIATAEIYAVFYTESKDELGYTGSAFCSAFYGSGEGRPKDDDSESKRIRKDFDDGSNTFIIGYFGGGMLSDAVVFDKLKIPEVIVKNGEDLVLYIKDYNSNINDRMGGILSITVKGKTSGQSKIYNVIVPMNSVAGREDLGYSLRKYGPELQEDNIYLIKTCTESDDSVTYEILLDSITEGPVSLVTGKPENAHFAHNFGGLHPGEDIEVTVSVGAYETSTEGVIHLAVPVARRVETNSLFASVTMNTSGFVSKAEVQQLRHLENIGNKISGVQLEAGCEVTITHSLSFDNRTCTSDPLLPVYPKDYTECRITYLNEEGNVKYPKGSFVPIDISFSSPDAAITVKSESFPSSEIDGHQIYNLCIKSPEGNVAGMGLFGTVNASLTVDDLGIVSSEYVTSSSTQNSVICSIYEDSKGRAAAIGAFVGQAEGNVTLNKCWSTVEIRQNAGANTSVGGFVGSSGAALTISRSYVSGQTGTDPKYPGRFNTATDAANPYVNAQGVAAGKTVNEGGFVGTANGALTIRNSYISASVGMDGLASASDYNVGGFVGYVASGVTVENSYFGGYMNLPLSYYVHEKAKLHYSGFVGQKPGGAAASFDASSFWIQEFHRLTDLPINAELQGNGVSFAAVDDHWTSPSYPYDLDHVGEVYPYLNATRGTDGTEDGLTHHWGDWTTEMPKLDVLIVPDAGIRKITSVDSGKGEIPANPNNEWVRTADGNGFQRDVEQNSGLKLDLENLVYVKPIEDYLDGFKGIVFTDYNQQPLTLDADGYFAANNHSTVIYVSAAALEQVPLVFTANGVGETERNKSFSQAYNASDESDIVLNTRANRSYDESVTVLYYISVSKTEDAQYRNLKNIDGSIYNAASVVCADVTDPLKGKPILLSKYTYTVAKDGHYGRLYYRIKAIACYADLPEGRTLADYVHVNGDAVTVSAPAGEYLPRIIFSEISENNTDELTFDVELYRTQVNFLYEYTEGSTEHIMGLYKLDDQKETQVRYAECGSAILYTTPGETVLNTTTGAYGKIDLQISKDPGAETAPPALTFDVQNAFLFFDWHDSGNNTIFYINNNGLTLQTVTDYTITVGGTTKWETKMRSLTLSARLEYITGEREFDPNGGYFD